MFKKAHRKPKIVGSYPPSATIGGSPPESSLKAGSLTPEEHLLKQMALRFLVDKRMRIKDVAKELNTTAIRIRSFFEDKEFTEELKERMNSVLGVDDSWRIDQAKISLNYMYEELRRREVVGELKDVRTRDLHKMIINVQKELRLDTPGAFTSKVGVTDLSKLQDRFNQSLSGRTHKMKRMSPEKKIIGLKEDAESYENNDDGSG